MAVNHVDGITFAGMLVCPICAAYSVSAKVGWLTIPCVAAALPVCISILFAAWALTYLAMGFAVRLAERWNPWAQTVSSFPFLLLYLVAPILSAMAAIFVTGYLAILLASFGGQLGDWTRGCVLFLVAVVSVPVSLVICKWWIIYTYKWLAFPNIENAE